MTRVDAGPKGIALAFRDGRAPVPLEAAPGASFRDGRLVWPEPADEGADRAPEILRVLEELADRLARQPDARACPPRSSA